MQRIIDTDTGEFQDLQEGERAVALGRGDRVLRENSLRFKRMSKRRFVKLYHLPTGLTPTEYKIVVSVLTPDHIRASDNVIKHSNGKTANRNAIASFAGMDNGQMFRRAMRELQKKGVIMETKAGLILNPEYATIGSDTLDKDTYNTFFGNF